MSDPTNLTPPADAPLPWRLPDGEQFILDALDNEVMFVENKAVGGPVARYLVAAANAAPGLVAERDAADRRFRDMEIKWAAAVAAGCVIESERDTALARVAALEAELDAYANAAATEIQALRQRVADLRWKAKP